MFAYVYNIMYVTTVVVVGYTLVGIHLYAPARTSVQFIRWHEYCLQSDSFNLCVLSTTVYDDDSSYVIISYYVGGKWVTRYGFTDVRENSSRQFLITAITSMFLKKFVNSLTGVGGFSSDSSNTRRRTYTVATAL